MKSCAKVLNHFFILSFEEARLLSFFKVVFINCSSRLSEGLAGVFFGHWLASYLFSI